MPPGSPSDGTLRFCWDFSESISMSVIFIVVASEPERAVPAVLHGSVPVLVSPGGRTTAPRAADASRIEMRLLRDTRSVLEYLPNKITERRAGAKVQSAIIHLGGSVT